MYKFFYGILSTLNIYFCFSNTYFIKVPTFESNPIATCLNMILENSFKSKPTLVMIDTKLTIHYPAITIENFKEHFKFFRYYFPEMYIISISNDTTIPKVFDFLQQNQMFNPRAKMVIIIKTFFSYETVFESFKRYFVANVVILDLNDNLATYDPYVFGNAMATGIYPTWLGKCSSFNFSSWNLWNKTFPFYWRNTTVAAIFTKHFPYLYYFKGKLDGENFQLITTLKEKLLFRLTTSECNLSNDNVSMTGLYFLNYICFDSHDFMSHLLNWFFISIIRNI